MLPPEKDNFLDRFLDKLSRSRDFTISFVLHLILVLIFGTTVLFQAVEEPPDFEGGSGGFVQQGEQVAAPPRPQQQTPTQQTFNVANVKPPSSSSSLTAITTSAPSALNFNINPAITQVRPDANAATQTATQVAQNVGQNVAPDGLTKAAAGQIKAFTGGWGKGQGSGVGKRRREFEFIAYLGRYAGGNWSVSVDMERDKVRTGSLPNLLYFMQNRSRDKIKTNYKNVEAINLASDEIFAKKPPFIFLTGSQDFVLTPKEVENLQKYVRMGGCIWGDSFLPGLRSRFDIAFKREMKRVIPDIDKQFETLPKDHPIFADTYFEDIREAPPGVNFYSDPVQALKIYGEIGILYTSNSYGGMWAVGLTPEGRIDTGRDDRGRFVAIAGPTGGGIPGRGQNEIYVRNINADAINRTMEFGTNVVIHLLTRWEERLKYSGGL